MLLYYFGGMFVNVIGIFVDEFCGCVVVDVIELLLGEDVDCVEDVVDEVFVDMMVVVCGFNFD